MPRFKSRPKHLALTDLLAATEQVADMQQHAWKQPADVWSAVCGGRARRAPKTRTRRVMTPVQWLQAERAGQQSLQTDLPGAWPVREGEVNVSDFHP